MKLTKDRIIKKDLRVKKMLIRDLKRKQRLNRRDQRRLKTDVRQT